VRVDDDRARVEGGVGDGPGAEEERQEGCEQHCGHIARETRPSQPRRDEIAGGPCVTIDGRAKNHS
jgi:hypothetical protein